MFSFFKRDSLKKALDACQQQLKSQGLELELTEKQYQMTISISTFNEIEARYKSKGLSQWGGLAWYCSYSIQRALEGQKAGKDMSDTVIELVNKTAGIALLLGNSIPGLKLVQNDMGAIGYASEIAMEWLDANESPADKELAEIMGN